MDARAACLALALRFVGRGRERGVEARLRRDQIDAQWDVEQSRGRCSGCGCGLQWRLNRQFRSACLQLHPAHDRERTEIACAGIVGCLLAESRPRALDVVDILLGAACGAHEGFHARAEFLRLERDGFDVSTIDAQRGGEFARASAHVLVGLARRFGDAFEHSGAVDAVEHARAQPCVGILERAVDEQRLARHACER